MFVQVIRVKNVLLIDGFKFVRSTVCELINSAVGMHVSMIAENVSEWIKSIRDPKKSDAKHLMVDVIVLDVSVPQQNGLESLADIKETSPQTPILVINGSENPHYAKRFIHMGCTGYISKQCDSKFILEGINALAQGDTEFIKPKTLTKEMKSHANSERADRRLDRLLTPRELQIFLKLANGKALSKIANDLSISDRTVSSFRYKILKKMHLKTNFDIISYAFNHNYLTYFDNYNKDLYTRDIEFPSNTRVRNGKPIQ
jgi:DNA-binding NarL/FixJ family response regulator